MAKLINKHGRLVSVSNSRVNDLLRKGFRHPEDSDFEGAAKRSMRLREFLLQESKANEGEVTDDTVLVDVAELKNSKKTPKVTPIPKASDETPSKDQGESEEANSPAAAISELLKIGKKPELEEALVAAGLKPEDYLTNDDRKAALQAFLEADG